MSTVKALAEVLRRLVTEIAIADAMDWPSTGYKPRAKARVEMLERLQDIIAVESAGNRLVENDPSSFAALRARAEKAEAENLILLDKLEGESDG